MPEMQEIRCIMGYPDPHHGSVATFPPTPSSQLSQASEENLVASPGTTDGTVSSFIGDSSTASSHRTTPVTSRRNSNQRHRQQVTPGEIELVDVNKHREPKHFAERINGVDTEALNRTLDRAGSRIVTMTGTIKRGKKADETVQVQLKLSQNEINKLSESCADGDKEKERCCGLKQGPHVLLFSIIFSPIAFIISFCMSFYLGTQAWYNLYLYLSEERTIWHRIFLCPLLIIFFPFLIASLSLGLGLWGMAVQLSWYLTSWAKEMRDPDKGFYGWLFNKINVPQCAPYQIVILDEPTSPENNQNPVATNL